jgi:hypothetical protein
MLLRGPCESVGTPVRNYGAINMAPTQKDQPLLSSKRKPHFKTHKLHWNEQKFDHGSRRGPKTRTTVLAKAGLRIVVSSQSQREETRELEYLISEPLPSNGLLYGPSLTALFRLSGVMSHLIYMFIWYCNGCLFWLSEVRGYTGP